MPSVPMTGHGFIRINESNINTDSHFIFCCFVQIPAIESGRYEMFLEGWNELDCCKTSQNRHAAVDDEGKQRDWRHFWKIFYSNEAVTDGQV